MPERILYPQFRDQWEPTKYPFGDRASLRNTDGRTILEGTLLDAHLYPIGSVGKLYLSRVVVDYRTVTVYVGDDNSETLASGSFYVSSPPASLKLQDAYERPAGILVSDSDRLAMFQTWGVGTHLFKSRQTEFAASCCMPTPEIGVRGIVLEDGSVFTGHVWIVGDDGVVVRREEVSLPACNGQPAQVVDAIRVDIVGDQLFRRRLCEDKDMFMTPNPVRTLRIRNGDETFDCTPDQFGNLSIQMNDALAADTVLRIRTTKDGIVIEAVGSAINA